MNRTIVGCTHTGCPLAANNRMKLNGDIVGFYCEPHAEEARKFFAWGTMEMTPFTVARDSDFGEPVQQSHIEL